MLEKYSINRGFKWNLFGARRRVGFSEGDRIKYVKHFYRKQAEIS